MLFPEPTNQIFQLFESEMRCALVEAEVREEVMHEMEERMQRMETMFQARLANEVKCCLWARATAFLTEELAV